MKNEQMVLDCPFCGGTAKIKKGYSLYYIACEGCGIKTPEGFKISAIQKWNTRQKLTPEQTALLNETCKFLHQREYGDCNTMANKLTALFGVKGE